MTPSPPSTTAAGRQRRRWLTWLAVGLAVGLSAYLAVAYVALPVVWLRYTHRHPVLQTVARVTVTADGIPGDPLNVALIGSEAEVRAALRAAGWFPADPLGMRSDVRIAADTVLGRPYDDAPVSNLYLFGRKEDLAYEKPVGHDPRKRNHVRFWKTDATETGGPVWIGSATYDERVGLSHTTGQITHHIGPDVDTERDRLFADLERTGLLSAVEMEPGFHTVLEGRNGGGDPWHTDGALRLGILRPQGDTGPAPAAAPGPTTEPTPAATSPPNATPASTAPAAATAPAATPPRS